MITFCWHLPKFKLVKSQRVINYIWALLRGSELEEITMTSLRKSPMAFGEAITEQNEGVRWKVGPAITHLTQQ